MVAKTLTGSSFLGIGALGILPDINASIIPLLVPVLPQLEQLQKEEGEFGDTTRYTRYLALFGRFLSGIAFFLCAFIFDEY